MRLLDHATLLAALDDPEDDLLPIAQVAGIVGVHAKAVRKWVHDERIGYVLVRGRQHVLVSQAVEAEHATRNAPRKRPRVTDGVYVD